MMGLPSQGTPEQRRANQLHNDMLAWRLDELAANRRAFSKAQADAYLTEAARRLRWPDAYANHGRDGADGTP